MIDCRTTAAVKWAPKWWITPLNFWFSSQFSLLSNNDLRFTTRLTLLLPYSCILSIFSVQLYYKMMNQISNLSFTLFSYVLNLILLMFSHELQTQPHHPFFIPTYPNKPLFMILNYLEPRIFYPERSLPTSNDMTPGNWGYIFQQLLHRAF